MVTLIGRRKCPGSPLLVEDLVCAAWPADFFAEGFAMNKAWHLPGRPQQRRCDIDMSLCDISGMPASFSDFLRISLPFGSTEERINSPRYLWDNRERGGDQFVIIQRTISGSGVFVWEGRSFPVPANHAFVATIPEESSYFFPSNHKTPWAFSWLNFYGPLAISLCRDLRRQYGPVLPLPRRSPAGSAFDALVRQGGSRAPVDPHDTSLACYAFLMEWARQLNRPGQDHPDPVETAVRICRTRFREPLGVKELAAESGISREHFTRLFAEKTGSPPALFLRELRADAAVAMMKEGDLPLKEAALRCGFASPRALSRALAARKSSPRHARGVSLPSATTLRQPPSRTKPPQNQL
jgi:AraC-like DNA-binding protein